MTDRQTDIKPHHRTWTWMLLKHRHIGSDIKLTNYNLYEKICYFWVFFFLHWQHPNNIESNMSRYQTKMMAVNTYFVISEEPESRGLVVFIVRDAQVVRSRLQNGVLVPRRLRFGFTFRHLAGVQGCLHRPAGCNGKKRRQPILVGSPLRLPRRFPAGHFPRTLKGAQKHPAEATCSASLAQVRRERFATFHIRRFSLLVVVVVVAAAAVLIGARCGRGVHVLVLRFIHI